MATTKPSTKKRPFTVWVDVKAQIGFTVLAENLETAVAVGHDELKDVQIISKDVEHMDSETKVIGVMEA